LRPETVSLAIREHESELSDALSVVSPGVFKIRRRTRAASSSKKARRSWAEARYPTMKICLEDNSI